METSHFSKILLCWGLLLPLWFYCHHQGQRPQRQIFSKLLFQGIHYQRLIQHTPRPYVIHVATIDLLAPGVEPWVTPLATGKKSRVEIGTPASPIGPTPSKDGGQGESAITSLPARTTREFVEEFSLQLGVNANYFYEFREHTPWDFYPRHHDPVYVVGEAIAFHQRYGSPRSLWPALCFQDNHRATIDSSGLCPRDTAQAIAGRDLLVDQGQALAEFPNQSGEKPYSRVAMGIDESGEMLWIVVIDGKQPLYSEGVTLDELALFVQDLGAYRAIAVDGGGSSTLVTATEAETTILNAPTHTKWPMRERPVANHLGFYALPVKL